MFCKIAVPKTFAITVKKTLVLQCSKVQSTGLHFYQKKYSGFHHRYFLKKFLRTAFLQNTPHCSLYFWEIFCENFLDVFGYQIDIFQISGAIALISFMLHGYSVLVIKPKFLVNVSVSFAGIIISPPALFLIELLKFRINFQITVSSPNNLHEYVNMSFLNVMLLLFLFRSGLARHGLKQ